jgi:cyclophilin family peptidyl-prolyl cis-trans isomerase
MQAESTLRLRRPALAGVALGFCLALAAGCGASNPPAGAAQRSSGGLHATLETEKGAIEIELFAADSPIAVENFRLLAERGYYNGTVFHRIIRGFMIQGGDPKGDGTGGESAWGRPFRDEIDRRSALYRGGYVRGIVAMANAGPNTNASQFFIMHRNYALPPNYVIFGRVIKGIEVVDALASTPTMKGPYGEMSLPVKKPVVYKVTISP